MGSKKYVMEPINLLPVVGIDIFNKSLKIDLLYLKSLIVILLFFGMNINNNSIDVNSLMIFISTTPVMDRDMDIFISLGINIIVSNSLVICSMIFENVTGNICSFPKK